MLYKPMSVSRVVAPLFAKLSVQLQFLELYYLSSTVTRLILKLERIRKIAVINTIHRNNVELQRVIVMLWMSVGMRETVYWRGSVVAFPCPLPVDFSEPYHIYEIL